MFLKNCFTRFFTENSEIASVPLDKWNIQDLSANIDDAFDQKSGTVCLDC